MLIAGDPKPRRGLDEVRRPLAEAEPDTHDAKRPPRRSAGREQAGVGAVRYAQQAVGGDAAVEEARDGEPARYRNELGLFVLAQLAVDHPVVDRRQRTPPPAVLLGKESLLCQDVGRSPFDDRPR